MSEDGSGISRRAMLGKVGKAAAAAVVLPKALEAVIWPDTSRAALAPVNGIAGAPMTLSATLTTSSGGTAVAGQTIAFDFATAGAFQVHYPTDPWINLRNVESATGFKENRQAVVAQLFHQRQRSFLQERFATGELNERLCCVRFRQLSYTREHIG